MPSNKEIVRMMKYIPMFSGCNDQQLLTIIKEAREEEFDSGTQILKEGEISFHFYLILEGQVEVSSKKKVLGTLEKGNFFGEMALLEELPRSADVIALRPTRCLVISQQELRKTLSSNSDIAIKMLQELCHRLRSADKKVLIGGEKRLELDEFLIGYLQKTVQSSRKEVGKLRTKLALSYYLLVILSTVMFLMGVFLICFPLITKLLTVAEPDQVAKLGSYDLFWSGLGIADLAALFLLKPLNQIHGLMGDIGQITLVVNSYRNQVALRLLETSPKGRDTMGEAAKHIGIAAEEKIKIIQKYFETKKGGAGKTDKH